MGKIRSSERLSLWIGFNRKPQLQFDHHKVRLEPFQIDSLLLMLIQRGDSRISKGLLGAVVIHDEVAIPDDEDVRTWKLLASLGVLLEESVKSCGESYRDLLVYCVYLCLFDEESCFFFVLTFLLICFCMS